ncbi:MAG: DUF721 domain-containing protein [Simkaniaceae bacterium]|nr:DUF721 domain-containing protein [Simkaniaceae bacterium]
MKKLIKRVPKNYQGLKPTGREIKILLPMILDHYDQQFNLKSERVLDAWKEIVGDQIASMSSATSFDAGIIKVKVKNSTLLSLLVNHESVRLLKIFKERFPSHQIKKILFNIG